MSFESHRVLARKRESLRTAFNPQSVSSFPYRDSMHGFASVTLGQHHRYFIESLAKLASTGNPAGRNNDLLVKMYA